jgi:DNA-binding ferritin-like protein
MKLELLTHLLCLLRAAHWSHWTSHWQVQGDPFYGDHQMLAQIYEEIGEEIDTLAEKLVGEFGPMAVDPVEQAQHVAQLLEEHAHDDPIVRALSMEEHLQRELTVAYNRLKREDAMSLGLDDFIMGVANTHETFVYMLRQKTRLHKTAGRIAGSTVATITPTRIGTRALSVGPAGELKRADTARLLAALSPAQHQHMARG